MTQDENLAVVGVGNMGEPLLAGMIEAGRPADSVRVVVRRDERAAELAAAYGVERAEAAEAAAWADTVLLAVKPYDILDVLGQLAGSLRPGAVVISVAAGISLEALQTAAPDAVVVRVMPNTPSKVGRGMSAVSFGAGATAEHERRVLAVVESVGRAVVVPEKLQNPAAALSGSGPAYLFLVAEAMVDAGVELGLPRTVATELATQTIAGAGALLESGEHPAVLKGNVTSPGGSTARGLAALERGGLRAAFLDALSAAKARNDELGA